MTISKGPMFEQFAYHRGGEREREQFGLSDINTQYFYTVHCCKDISDSVIVSHGQSACLNITTDMFLFVWHANLELLLPQQMIDRLTFLFA